MAKDKSPAVASYLKHGDVLEDAVVEACYWKHQYEKSNPNVGMGPFLLSTVRDVMIQLNVDGVLDEDTVLNRVKKLIGD